VAWDQRGGALALSEVSPEGTVRGIKFIHKLPTNGIWKTTRSGFGHATKR
jgi:hypothetical protein